MSGSPSSRVSTVQFPYRSCRPDDWVTVIFASFSLFAEHSTLGFGALLVFALSVSSSLFLIMELTHPSAGLLQIPSEQFKDVLSPLNV
ncbi:hypothetical protein V1291_004314 [Nitrobacteraceae bacterium AZCC 1564]